jgi:hypothetical protein
MPVRLKTRGNTPCAGDDQPQLAAFGQDPLVRARLWQPIQTRMFFMQ